MDPRDSSQNQFNLSLILGAVVGQVGCLTLVIILLALFGGIWLDDKLGTKPLFTIGLMAASVPLTLVMMFWVVRKATARLQTKTKDNSKPRLPEADESEEKEKPNSGYS